MRFDPLRLGDGRVRRFPRLSSFLLPMAFALRACWYIAVLAVVLLFTAVVVRLCWRIWDFLDREFFSLESIL